MNHTENLKRVVEKNITNSTEMEIKKDLKFIISSIVDFIGNENPELLNPELDDDERQSLFFKLITGLVQEGITSQFSFLGGKKKFEQKFENLTGLYPLLIKYSNEK